MTRWERAVLLALLLGGLAAVLLCTYLPMNDAPSHVANSTIAWRLLQGDAFFLEHYRLPPTPVPYWAITLLMLPLIPIFGPLHAYVIVMAAYVVLLPLSFYYLARTAAPQSVGLTPVAALLSFNWAYWFGVANFLVGQPAILFAFALFIKSTRPRAPAFAGFLVLAAFCYLSHLFVLITLALLVGSFLAWRLFAWRLLRVSPRPEGVSKAQWAAAAWTGLLSLIGVYFVLLRTDTNQGAMKLDLSFHKLLHVAIDAFDSPEGPSHLLTPAIVLALAVTILSPRLGAIRRDPARALPEMLNLPLLLPALALLAMAILGPARVVGADGEVKEFEINSRFVVCGVLLLLSAVRPPEQRGWRAALLIAVALFGAVKLADVVRLHRRYDATVREISRTLLAKVPEHRRLLPLMDIEPQDGSRVDFTYHRIGSYVVPVRQGYSPNVFAIEGQHPLRHVRWGDYRSVADRRIRAEEWTYYDYVLVQARRDPPEIPGLLQRAAPLGRVGDFLLYRIDKDR